MAEKIIEISIGGKGAEPETVRLRDLYEILHSFESAIGETSGQLADFHLVAIQKGDSADCTIAIPSESYPAAIRCATAIASRDLSALPERARSHLVGLKAKAKLKTWTFRLSGPNGIPTAEIAPSTEFTTDSIISGRTSITARLIRIGGTPKATAQLSLIDGQKLTATIASQELAVELSPLLYRTLSMTGDAKWSSADWSLTDFRITGIDEYDDETSVINILGELKGIAGNFWDEIDPDEFISTQRQEG